MKYRLVLLLGLIAFAVTLAVVVGQRLSSEAMAVIVGVVAGVAASIPTSLIIVWVASRSAEGQRAAPAPAEAPTPAPLPARANTPRLVVVQPQAAPNMALPTPVYGYGQAGYAMPYPAGYAAPQQRTFTVIGEEAFEGLQPAWAGDGSGLIG